MEALLWDSMILDIIAGKADRLSQALLRVNVFFVFCFVFQTIDNVYMLRESSLLFCIKENDLDLPETSVKAN